MNGVDDLQFKDPLAYVVCNSSGPPGHPFIHSRAREAVKW